MSDPRDPEDWPTLEEIRVSVVKARQHLLGLDVLPGDAATAYITLALGGLEQASAALTLAGLHQPQERK